MEVLQKQQLSYREFREIEFDENDNSWYELINGEIVKKQSPTIHHQRVCQQIEFALYEFALQTKSGEMFHAPLDVVLDDKNQYQPDVMFIKKGREFVIDQKEGIIIGSPDLVVEILSKSTAQVRPRREKRLLRAQRRPRILAR